MWNPLRDAKLRWKKIGKNLFFRDVRRELGGAMKLADAGEKLLALNAVRQKIDSHHLVEILDVEFKAEDRVGIPMLGGIAAGILGGVAVVALHPAIPFVALAGFAAAGGWAGRAAGRPFARRYRARQEKEYAPFQARLDGLRAKADAAAKEILAQRMPDLAASPSLPEIFKQVPGARDAFVAAAQKGKVPPPPPQKPDKPDSSLNL
jgi:hypothetical protein